MNISGVITRIVHAEIHQSGPPRLAEQTLRAEAIDETGEDGEDVDAHRPGIVRVMIFHLTDPDRWAQSLAAGEHTGSSRGVELADEGFIHCSTAAQWPVTVDRFYADVDALLLLHIDEALLDVPLVIEQLGEAPEPFPHVYGPIPMAAVVEVERLR